MCIRDRRCTQSRKVWRSMPQVSAALVRSAPSKTIASANIRRDAALSFSRPAAARSSMAVKSLRVTEIAAIVLAPHHTKSSSIQTFSDSGTPTSHPFSPLVLEALTDLSKAPSISPDDVEEIEEAKMNKG